MFLNIKAPISITRRVGRSKSRISIATLGGKKVAGYLGETYSHQTLLINTTQLKYINLSEKLVEKAEMVIF